MVDGGRIVVPLPLVQSQRIRKMMMKWRRRMRKMKRKMMIPCVSENPYVFLESGSLFFFFSKKTVFYDFWKTRIPSPMIPNQKTWILNVFWPPPPHSHDYPPTLPLPRGFLKYSEASGKHTDVPGCVLYRFF